jgi:CubicO group peptidase (beta-lactamase class C family)
MPRWLIAFLTILGLVLALVSLRPTVMAQNTASATRPGPNLLGVAPMPLTGDRRTAFDAYLADAVIRFGVPGASVAVVQNGEVVYLKGFGVTETGDDALVDPDTLFAIASTTKAFTSAMAATAVDDGSLSWDTPWITYYPISPCPTRR